MRRPTKILSGVSGDMNMTTPMTDHTGNFATAHDYIIPNYRSSVDRLILFKLKITIL